MPVGQSIRTVSWRSYMNDSSAHASTVSVRTQPKGLICQDAGGHEEEEGQRRARRRKGEAVVDLKENDIYRITSSRWGRPCDLPRPEPVVYPPFGAPTRRLPALTCELRQAVVMPDRTLVASWTPYEWRRAHERGSSGDSEVGRAPPGGRTGQGQGGRACS